MYRIRAALAVCLALLFAVSAGAQALVPAPLSASSVGGAALLDGSAAKVNLEPFLTFFLDASGTLTADQLEALPDSSFSAVNPARAYLVGDGALWFRFDAINHQPQTHWRLLVPLPGVDDVVVYYRNPAGSWTTQQAGDTRAMSTWTQPARYPVFSTSYSAGQAVRYFVKIQHARVPYSVLPRIVSDAQLLNTELSDHLLLGAYFGLAALVVVLALANTLARRDLAFGTYALYMVLFTLSQGMFIGVAGLYWWPEWPELNKSIIFVLTLAATAGTWFVRTVVMPKRFFRWLDVALLALMATLPLAGLADMLLQNRYTFNAFNALVSCNLVVLLAVVGIALVAGDKHSRWVAYGFTPVLLAALVPLLRNLGVVQSSFWTEYALLLGSAIEVPILFYGLNRRMAQGRDVSARASGLRVVDPLTGVYVTKILTDKLQGFLEASSVYRQPFAMLCIELTNFGDLQKKYNRETADRALVMAAVRIRSAARLVDTVARIGDAQFALLMAGPVNAVDANEVATQIVAAGLRANDKLPEREPLRFNIALHHHSEFAAADAAQAEAMLAQLLVELKVMNDGSTRTIRLVKA